MSETSAVAKPRLIVEAIVIRACPICNEPCKDPYVEKCPSCGAPRPPSEDLGTIYDTWGILKRGLRFITGKKAK